MPKYEIVRSIGGGAVLDMLSEDLKEEKQTLAFEPIDKGDMPHGSNAFGRTIRGSAFKVVAGNAA